MEVKTDNGVSAEVDETKPEKEVEKTPKRTKDDKVSKKKVDKCIEQELKTLKSIQSADERFEVLSKKYTSMFTEYKRMLLFSKDAEREITGLRRENGSLISEQGKHVLTRNRLESLCRELQKQNKAMKEESLLRIREEEEKRKEVSAKFHTTMAEITALMQQNTESNSKLRDENLDMQSKFKSVCEQYELREQQVDKISKQMKLESQLAEAKLRKAKLEMMAEKEILERDKQQLLAEIALLQGKLADHEKTEELLRAQINVYFEKYDEFQNVLTKSNQVYSGFKGEMEKMSKKITRLEKETSTWKQKWEGSHRALILLAQEKQLKDQEVQLQTRQLTQLQKLCRTLQTDRASLLQQLKAEGIAPKLKEGSPLSEKFDPMKPEASSVDGEPSSSREKRKSSKSPKEEKEETNVSKREVGVIQRAPAANGISAPSCSGCCHGELQKETGSDLGSPNVAELRTDPQQSSIAPTGIQPAADVPSDTQPAATAGDKPQSEEVNHFVTSEADKTVLNVLTAHEEVIESLQKLKVGIDSNLKSIDASVDVALNSNQEVKAEREIAKNASTDLSLNGKKEPTTALSLDVDQSNAASAKQLVVEEKVASSNSGCVKPNLTEEVYKAPSALIPVQEKEAGIPNTEHPVLIDVVTPTENKGVGLVEKVPIVPVEPLQTSIEVKPAVPAGPPQTSIEIKPTVPVEPPQASIESKPSPPQGGENKKAKESGRRKKK